MLQMFSHLPAFELVEPLQHVIANSNVVVGAPPGAGKSTILPLALLQADIDGKVLLMQPRRVVVRNLADFLAKQLGEQVGQTVGYRIKGESKTSASTKLEIITEGILSRMIQQDPELTGIGAIVFDEFHERSIHSDFGLALALEVQAGLRDDLRLVVMSATLDIEPLNELMQQHSVLPTQNLNSEGRTFPVEVRYTNDVLARDVNAKVTDIIKHSVVQDDGDILVFLPGRGSIHSVASNIETLVKSEDIALHFLYGALSKEAQQNAISKDINGRRKIILSTNIAETSLTIEGVKVVIDSLWENSAQYHASSDITQLTQQRISQASATQRMGRAGRVSEGVCYRLCSKESFERLAKHGLAQIETEDLSDFLLSTYTWGSTPNSLALLTKPSSAQLSAASHKLQRIGAVSCVSDKANTLLSTVTPYGRELSGLPCQVHLAHLLLSVKNGINGLTDELNQQLKLAAPIVVALSEGQVQLKQSASSSQTMVADVLLRCSANERNTILRQAQRYARYVGLQKTDIDLSSIDEQALGLCIAIAHPMQVAYLKNSNAAVLNYKLASGKGAELSIQTNNTSALTWLAVLDGQLINSNVAIRQAQPVQEDLLQRVFKHAFTESFKVMINTETGQLESRSVYGFYDIVLRSAPITAQEKAKNKAFIKSATVNAWLAYLQKLPIQQWPLSDDDWQWWNRVALAGQINLPQEKAFDEPERWPRSLKALLELSIESVKEALAACTSIKALNAIAWNTLLNNALSWPQQDALAQLLPSAITIPTGRKAKLDYRANGDVVLAVKMTEMYSQAAPLTVANGKVPVVCELLSPAGRPLQTTSNLQAFWQGSYKEIQKEMKGRYPKHFWPDDPSTASPTAKTKKNM